MKIWRILIGVLFIYLFCHCSQRSSYGEEWYSLYYKGYDMAVGLSKNLTRLNGNSFLLGQYIYRQGVYQYTYYSIWSYFTIGVENYLIIYKITDKGNILFYRIYHYNQPIKWIYQYNDSEVGHEVFKKFAILDGDPFYLSLLTQKRIVDYSLNMSLHIFNKRDTSTIENDFLWNLRNDIIKYNLIELSTSK